MMKTKSKFKKETVGLFIITIGIVLAIYSLLMLSLMFWGFNTSLKHRMDFDNPGYNVLGLPDFSLWTRKGLSIFNNYQTVIENMEIKVSGQSYYTIFSDEPVRHFAHVTFWSLIWNTISYCILASIIQTIVPTVVGFMCAKYRYKYSEIVYTTVLVVMMLPIVGTAPAELKLLKDLALYDTLIGNLIQKFHFSDMYFLIFFAFFQGIPDSYQEAAEIDGASQFRVISTIMIPLAIKLMGTVFLLRAVGYWNDYNSVLMYLPTRPTFAYAIYDTVFLNHQAYEMKTTTVRIAGSMLLVTPILIIFLIFKDRLMGNVSIGGIKG